MKRSCQDANAAALVDAGHRFIEALASFLVGAMPAAAGDQLVDQDTNGVLTRRSYLQRARAGCFPTKRCGKRVVAKRADLLAWIESQPSHRAQRESSIQTRSIDIDAEVTKELGLRLVKGTGPR